MPGADTIIDTKVQYDYLVHMFVYIFSRIFDTCLSLYMKGYYISTTTFIVLLRVLREICHTKTSPPQKSLNLPYAGFLFVFQIFFCVWETKKESQIEVE